MRTYRVLSKDWKIGHETLRKFVVGETLQPHPRQLALYGTRFLELHPSGYVREKRLDGGARALEQLKLVLPPGRENAHELVDSVFALAARSPDGVPEGAEALREWILKVLDAEYEAEVRFSGGRKSPRRPAE